MSDIDMTKSEEEICKEIDNDRLHSKERLEEMGIDLDSEDNSIPSLSVSSSNIVQKEFDLEGYIKRHSNRVTMFSGSDSFIYVNNKDISIIGAFKVDTLATADITTKTITMAVAIPSGNHIDMLNELLTLKNGTVLEIFCNEYGDSCYREFTGVEFMYEDNYVDANTIAADTLLTFSFEESSPYKKGLPTIKNN